MKKSPLRDWLDRQRGVAKFVVESGNDAETCDILVCRKFNVVEGLIFADNLIGQCAGCGCAVQFRPHAPTKPKRLCYDCTPNIADHPDIKMMVTKKTAAELATYCGAKGRKQ